VPEEEKRAALEAVLASSTFGRSAQLRALLKYVCEMEMAGRAGELSEYQIAVDVLDRPKDVSLSDDSSVRNRAYELRQRLEKYYTSENPEALVRIEIPKGGYVPAWIWVGEAPVASEPERVERRGGRSWPMVLGAVVCAALGWLGATLWHVPVAPSIVREAWGPLADANTDVLICVATHLHLLVRPYIPDRPGRMEAPKELYREFRLTRPLAADTPLYMEPALLSVPLGEAAALTNIVKMRASFGGAYELLPESEAPIPALIGRNAILIGTPVHSNAVTFILSRQRWTVGVYNGSDFAVIDQEDKAKPKAIYTPVWRGDSEPSTVYGLLTVTTTNDSAGHARRLVTLTGTGSSAGIHGTVEYFSSPEHLKALKERFVAAGLSGFPPNYQVVVRCVTQRNRAVGVEYAAHVVGK